MRVLPTKTSASLALTLVFASKNLRERPTWSSFAAMFRGKVRIGSAVQRAIVTGIWLCSGACTSGVQPVVTPVLAPAPPSRLTPAREAFWRNIVQSGFQVPAGHTALQILRELPEIWRLSDPSLRDDIGYGIASRWLVREPQLKPQELSELVQSWSPGLFVGIGTLGGDSVYGRSFAALGLSLIAARDLKEPSLSEAELEQLLSLALDYLQKERDLRGYDAVDGWAHALAHTADLLKFLLRNPRVGKSANDRVLYTLAHKLQEAGYPAWVSGEDDRLAALLLASAQRAEFDSKFVLRWVERIVLLQEQNYKVPRLDADQLTIVENHKHLFRALHFGLQLDPHLTPELQAFHAALGTAMRRL